MSVAMPKPDEALRDFFKDDEIFAALFNGFFFEGANVIKADDLKTLDTFYAEAVSFASGRKKQKVNKYRDILRVSSAGIFMILGIENQEKIHYAMPLRNMLYDALQYCTELSVKVDTHKKSEWTVDERLSKMAKDTKVTPVCTVVFYTGEKVWDGPRSLHEMMDLDEHTKSIVIDYPIHVIDLGHDETLSFPNELLDDLRDILKSAYAKRMGNNKRVVHNSMLSLASILMNDDKLYQHVVNEEKGGKREMCKALDELREEWLQEAEARTKAAIDEKNIAIDEKNIAIAVAAEKDIIIAERDAKIKELEAKLAALS